MGERVCVCAYARARAYLVVCLYVYFLAVVFFYFGLVDKVGGRWWLGLVCDDRVVVLRVRVFGVFVVFRMMERILCGACVVFYVRLFVYWL